MLAENLPARGPDSGAAGDTPTPGTRRQTSQRAIRAGAALGLALSVLLGATAAVGQETSTDAAAGTRETVVLPERDDEQFRGWTVRCFADSEQCLTFSKSEGAQLIVAETGNEQTPADIVIHIPPGAQVGDPVALHLDSDLSFQAKIWNCTARYCEARVAPSATGSVILRLVADTKGLIIYRLGDDLQLVRVSLGDFDKAWKAARN